jgi:hypothetical protein
VAVGVELGVGVGVEVGVAVAVELGVAVGVELGVGVGVPLGQWFKTICALSAPFWAPGVATLIVPMFASTAGQASIDPYVPPMAWDRRGAQQSTDSRQSIQGQAGRRSHCYRD